MATRSKISLSYIDRLYHFFSKQVVRHVLAWITLFGLFVVANQFVTQDSLGKTLIKETINIVFYIAIVYFNLKYLIPNYLTQKTFTKYCIILILTVMVLTPIRTILLYFVDSNQPEIQEYLIFNQGYIFLSIFIIAGSSTLIQVMTDWLRHNREKKELQTQTIQSELNFLKSQINPHFLFNSLNSLYALTLKKSDDAPQVVIKLSEIMRYMLYECNERFVPLRKEVNYLQNYLDLEKIRQGGHVDIKFVLIGRIGEQKIAPLMFIPFIENSFKHGLSSQITEGFVHIFLEVKDQLINLTIKNSKAPSLPVQEHKRSGGIGLVNVKRRLAIIYPDSHTLDIKDEPTSYTVDLTIVLG